MTSHLNSRRSGSRAASQDAYQPHHEGAGTTKFWRPKVGDLVREKGDPNAIVMRIYRLPKLRGENSEYNVEVGRNGGILYRNIDLEPAIETNSRPWISATSRDSRNPRTSIRGLSGSLVNSVRAA